MLAINNIANGAFVTEANDVSLATISRTVAGTPNTFTNSGGKAATTSSPTARSALTATSRPTTARST
jgi:hypothetical protein